MRIGTDIVHIRRIESVIEKHGSRFLDRVFNPAEQKKLSLKPESLAGYWAAKEAIAKALGCGIGAELSFLDITITKDPKGAPSFELSRRAQARFPIRNHSVSISHDGGMALAVVGLVLSDD